MTKTPMAALRDASIYRTHRQTDTLGHIPVHHLVNPDEPFYSRCGRLIDAGSEVPARSVMSRCGRPGCRGNWPQDRVGSVQREREDR